MFELKQATLTTVFIKTIFISSVLILTACTSFEPHYQRPALPVPQQFSLGANALVESTDEFNIGWKTFFTTAQLKQLIATALQNNRDLQTATLKVSEAAELYNITNADRYPQLNASSDVNYSGGMTSQSKTTHKYNIGMNLGYELDFFGKLKNMSEADRQNFFSSQQSQRTVHILVVSQVAQSYLNTILARRQKDISQQSLQNYQRSFQFIEQRIQVGKSSLLDLEQARGLIEVAKNDIAKRQGELTRANNALHILTGKYSLPESGFYESSLADFTVNSADNHIGVDNRAGTNNGIGTDNSVGMDSSIGMDSSVGIFVPLPENLSSNILLQRPDISAAEHQLLAANANIGVARAAFFPSVSLTGSLSSGNTDISSLFDAVSGMWSFIPKVELPIFNGGRNKANLSLAEIRQQLSVVNYEQKIQNAFKEVADALSLRESLSRQISAQERYLNSLKITSQRANALYVSGAVSYLDVLDAERTLFSTRQDLLDSQYALQVNEINLFTALGGGWTE